MKEGKNLIINGAFILGVSTLISKILGALYRLPLTNLLGGYGMGVYALLFPIYALLIDLVGAGFVSSISKCVAKEPCLAYKYFAVGKKILTVLGIFCTIIMFVIAKPLSILQGEKGAFLGYLLLAPSIFAVAISYCYRGYFQGKMNMRPTAIFNLLEQGVKLILGLVLVKLFMPNVALAVAGASFAVCISQWLSLLFLKLSFNKIEGGKKLYIEREEYNLLKKELIYTATPVTLIGLAIPLSHFIDSFLIVKLIGEYSKNALLLYGLFSGGAHTLINLPVSLCHGISTVTIPLVSGQCVKGDNRCEKMLLLTAITSTIFALAIIFFAPLIVKILFRNFTLFEKETVKNLLVICSPSVLFLSLLQTENAVLIGKGKPYLALIGLYVGIVVKVTAEVLLVKIPALNIYGAGVGLNACYLVACLVNLILISRKKVKYANKTYSNRQYAS